MFKIDECNRSLVIDRYVTDIVARLHYLETREMLKECLYRQKNELSNDELEIEIQRHDPGLLVDLYVQETIEV